MKAQRFRKLLWTLNLALGAGVAGVGALLVLDKPVEADLKFVSEALSDYKTKSPQKLLQPALKEEDVKQVLLKPEWKDLPYYPFVGPKPPPKKEKVVAPTDAPKGPTGLETIGRVLVMMYVPPEGGQKQAKGSSVLWQFGDKKTLSVSPGKFVAQKGQPERFKLVDVVQVTDSSYKLLYEVYDDPAGKPSSTGELVYDNTPKPSDRITGGTPPAPPKDAPAAGAGAATAAAPAGPAAPGGKPTGYTVVGPEGAPAPAGGAAASKEWRASVSATSANRRRMEFDEGAFNHLKGKTVDQVLENVRTEEYNRGGVQGLQIFPAGDTSMAERFDVRRGDILIAINGQPTKTRADAVRVAQALPPDTSLVTIEVDRDGKRIFYDVDPRDPKVRRAAAGIAPK